MTLSDPAHNNPNPIITIMTCMKNEGPFIMEWIAYHRSIGVTNFVIYTNDCDDGTTELLDHLDLLGIVQHLPNPGIIAKKPYWQPNAIHHCQSLPLIKRSDYVIFTDVDEFINIQVGNGHLRDLFNAIGPFHCLSMNELNFSSSGHFEYQDIWLTENYREHEPHYPGDQRAKSGLKTIYHGLSSVERPSIHRPIILPGSEDELIWITGGGQKMSSELYADNSINGIDRRGNYRFVCLDHHANRSVQSFTVKHDRGDSVAQWRRVGTKYYRQRNLGGRSLGWIQNKIPNARKEWEQLMSEASTRTLHETCVQLHKEKIAKLEKEEHIIEMTEWITQKYFPERMV